MTRLLLSLEEAPIGQVPLAFECDSCARRSPCRDPDRLDRLVPRDWLETVPHGELKRASADEDATLHWCQECAARGSWIGQPLDLAALPEIDST